MLQFSDDFKEVLLRYLKEVYLSDPRASVRTSQFNDKDIQYFSKGAGLLSDAFTSDRNSLAANYFNNPVLRSGYLLYFLPVNMLKVVRIMQELEPAQITQGKVRVLDLGCGPGTGFLGLMDFYSQAIRDKKIKEACLDATLIDQSYPIIKDATNLHRAYTQALEKKVKGFSSLCSVKHFDMRRESLGRFLRGFRYHLIIVSNVLNEFNTREEQAQFIEYLIKEHLDPKHGKIIIIEPALKTSSRDLQFVRDEVAVNKKLIHVHSPCLHQEICPLNKVNLRDWCHFYFSWKRPDFIGKVDKLIGNKKDWLACSYLLLSTQERKKIKEDTWRLISNMMPSKGKKEVVLCGPKGRAHATRLDKNAHTPNRDFSLLRRGDLVQMSTPSSYGSYRIDGELTVEKESSVKILNPI